MWTESSYISALGVNGHEVAGESSSTHNLLC